MNSCGYHAVHLQVEHVVMFSMWQYIELRPDASMSAANITIIPLVNSLVSSITTPSDMTATSSVLYLVCVRMLRTATKTNYINILF